MRRRARGVLFALVANMLLRLSLTNDHLVYIKASMRPWLVVSGVLLAALAVVDLFGWLAVPTPDHDHGDDHAGHRHGLLPWILLAPVVVVFAIGPAPLGAFTAERQQAYDRAASPAPRGLQPGDIIGPGAPVSPATGGEPEYRYPPLPPPTDGAVDLRLPEFTARVANDNQRQMDGVLVRLDGFVSREEGANDDTFLLSRFMISCCAADASAVSVRARGLTPRPADDTWLRVEGYWIPHTGELPYIDDFRIVTAVEILTPENPYA